MSVATLANIEKTFGKRVLFQGLNLNVERGERLGFIGANGAGKTTLFKVLTGEVIPDAGVVALAKGTKVGHLTQDPQFDPGNTVMDEAELAFAQLHDMAHRLREIEHEMGNQSGEALEKTLARYQAIQHDFELAGGYVWHHRLEATLLGVGLGRDTWQQNVGTLSGGQRSRLSLAKILISEPDLLLLDEPTNHLDLAAIEWLEKYLLDFSGAVVLISHDRYLLDRLSTRIVWLTGNALRSYPGNYSSFVQQRELQELTQQRQFERQQEDVEKQKEFIRRFGAGQRSKEAKGRETRLDRLLKSDQMIDRVASHKKISLSLDTDQRAGDQVLTVKELSKSFGPKVLWQSIGFDAKRGERLGIIGPNGSGKTTLLRVLVGEDDADAGDVRWGANLNIGYYDQRLDDFDPELTVLETIAEGRPTGTREQDMRDVLATMLFRGDDIHKPVGMLSGGERARVRFAQLLMDKPNVLILDEPTNHLDIPSREALEGALSSYPGTVMCVSHDRFFLDRVAQRLLILAPPGIDDFPGTYTAWQHKLREEHAEREALEIERAKQQKSASGAIAARQAKPKSSNKDNPYARPFGRLSTEELERQITDTEVAIAECQTSFGDAGAFKEPSRGKTLQAEYEGLVKKLEALEQEYYARET
jgi:ATP-binding cassette subfamily F protein 3